MNKDSSNKPSELRIEENSRALIFNKKSTLVIDKE